MLVSDPLHPRESVETYSLVGCFVDGIDALYIPDSTVGSLVQALAVESPSIFAAVAEYTLIWWMRAGVRVRSEVDNALLLNNFNILIDGRGDK
jgi:hypothetical protein